MLTCQLIVALVAAVKRFDAVVMHLPAALRRVVSRARVGGSDLQET
jgi:hypothetical protein